MDHDPHCNLNPCICGVIAGVRSEERTKMADTWTTNIRLIEIREYERGYNDRAKGAECKP
jgi:hypothetical protein